MSDVTKVVEEAQELTDEEVQQLLDFIAELKRKRREPKRGSVDAIMRAVGCWWMTPEETEQFLHEIEELRHMEDPERDIPPRF